MTTSPRNSQLITRLCLALAAVAVGLAYLQEPGLGDDIDYWGRAFALHEAPDSKAAALGGFHSLRWPVWGVCWLLQGLLGPGLASYYGEPLLYLILGTLLVHALATEVLGDGLAPRLAAVVFLLHPLLDPAITRPMPDLSEGFWCAAAVWTWLRCLRAETWRQSLPWAAACGVALATGYANRITGLLITPVLAILTLWQFRSRFPRVLWCGLFAAAFVLIECLIYWKLTGDFWHSLHANLGARGRKGTEMPPLWLFPFRFLDSVWSGAWIKIPLNLVALLGMWHLWRRGSGATRATALWPLLYFVIFSCMLQSVSPPRPVVRDGDRFLASLAFPLSVCAGAGLALAGAWLASRWPAAADRLGRQPWLLCVVALGALAAASPRDTFNPGYVPAVRDRVTSTPPGTTVLSHQEMRDVAYLVAPQAAARLAWEIEPDLLHVAAGDPRFTNAQAVWVARKLVWTSRRKQLERHAHDRQPPLLPPLLDPAPGWTLVQSTARDGVPDFMFFRRTQSGDPAPIQASGPDLPPASFEAGPKDAGAKRTTGRRPLPDAWRGCLAHVGYHAIGNEVEAVSTTLVFFKNGKPISTLVLKPYLYPGDGHDFQCFTIPADATEWELRGTIAKSVTSLRLLDWRLTLFPPPAR